LRKEAQIRGNSALKLETHPILNCRTRCYFTNSKSMIIQEKNYPGWNVNMYISM
jgi:hypothetical protein